MGYVESVAIEQCLSDAAPDGRWAALSRLSGLPAFHAPPGARADAQGIHKLCPRSPRPARSAGAVARLRFKSALAARQSEGAGQQRWAAGVGGAWEPLACELALEQRLEQGAEAIVRSARTASVTTPTPRLRGRRTPVLPMPEFAAGDVREWDLPPRCCPGPSGSSPPHGRCSTP